MMGMFDKPTKRGCQPFNWLVEGFGYRAKLDKGVVDAEEMPLLAPRRSIHEFFDDFLVYNSGDWDANNTQSGSGQSVGVSDAVAGEIALTTADSEDDAEQLTFAQETFKLVSDKKLWFEARAKVDAATEHEFVLGLIANEDLTAVGDLMPADGVVFKKDDGDTNTDVASSKDGTDDESTGIATLDTDYHRYGLYFDGDGTIEAYVDGEKVATLETTICDDEELAPVMMAKTGQGSSHTLTVDYIEVVQER